MKIQRIDSYTDHRFSPEVLRQHGAFLADDRPFSVQILSNFEAVISGETPEYFLHVIEEFRFYAEHITTFYDEEHNIVANFPKVSLFDVALQEIQPSQFYVDEEKVRAVSGFLFSGEDVVIPLIKFEGRYLSLDGHTRMFAANKKGISVVKGFLSRADDSIFDFAREAQHQGIFSPVDLTVLPHEEYCRKWHKFCDDFFAERAGKSL